MSWSHLLPAAFVATLACAPVHAALYLNPIFSPPFSLADTDGQIGPIGPLADYDPFVVTGFDIIYDSFSAPGAPPVGPDFSGGVPIAGAPGTWSFSIGVDDPGELSILPLVYTFDPTFAVAAAGGFSVGTLPTALPFPGGGVDQIYTLGAPLADGTIIATVSILPVGPGVAPHDDFPDLTLFGVTPLGPGPLVYDPALGALAPSVSVDAETPPPPPVPLPASALLLAGAILALVASGRIKARSNRRRR